MIKIDTRVKEETYFAIREKANKEYGGNFSLCLRLIIESSLKLVDKMNKEPYLNKGDKPEYEVGDELEYFINGNWTKCSVITTGVDMITVCVPYYSFNFVITDFSLLRKVYNP